jgi:AraC-like DNA-binding protein
MELKLGILPILLLLGAIQGLLLSVILFFYRKNENILSNKILSVTIFLMSINLLYAVFFTSGLILNFAVLIRFLDTIQFLTPPLIYLYVLSLTRNDFKFKKSYILFILPFLISSIYLYSSSPPIDQKIAFYHKFLSGEIPIDFKIIFSLKIIYGLIFLMLSFHQLKKHSKLINQIFEITHNKTLSWLRNLLLFLLLIWIVALVRPLFDFNINSIYMLGISVSITIYFISANQIKQRNIYSGVPNEIIETVKNDSDNKYKNSNLSKEEQKEIFLKIDAYCRQEKPFLENECNLNFIADKTSYKPHIISQVLNLYANKSYYEYLNDLKAEEAEKNLKVAKYKMLTIDAIGELSGFRSKATFYSSFKKKYGKTPMQYQKAS